VICTQPALFGIEQQELTSDDYYTPRWVFDAMGLTFDLDVCAPPGGIPWIPAARYFTQADDGLAQPWDGRVWMNPPFSGTGRWVDRFIAHGNGVCIIPHSRSRWHARLWATDAAFVDPNSEHAPSMFQFIREGVETNVYMPVFMAAFGDECVEVLHHIGPVRRLVR
jgi:DNA N-6-adenine-methyltransferase (Dam)